MRKWMNKSIQNILSLWGGCMLLGCTSTSSFNVKVIETSAQGDQWSVKSVCEEGPLDATITLHPELKYQTITGFGGAFTESSAHLLNALNKEARIQVLEAYFGVEGANYSLTRTHINSCDFSLNPYSYVTIEHDSALMSFSIEEDKEDLIPMIQEAQAISKDGFKLVASPWTAPPWMKDNLSWNGGKLLPEYYSTWANYFVKYHQAYAEEGIDIWAYTVENEPLGNNANWESMHYTPQEMGDFIAHHLKPAFRKEDIDSKVLVYDQNRGEELNEWGDMLLTDTAVSSFVYGTAVHWYNSTFDYFPTSLDYIHDLNPNLHIIETEGCVDADKPHWEEDGWYWSKEATDWGFDWASEEDKAMHPPYVPVYRYARDMIGCMNHWVEGWIDWNMVLDKEGGPNHAKNWCVAPVLVDTNSQSIYYTPLYYVMGHFSKYIRPGAVRIGFDFESEGMMTTAVKNENQSMVIVLLNMNDEERRVQIVVEEETINVSIKGKALQTIVIEKNG